MTTPRVPLSAAQMQFWIGQKLAGDAPLYNMAWRFDLQMALDPNLFAQAFHDVAQKSDALRVRFSDDDGVPWQSTGIIPPFPTFIDATRSDLSARIASLIAAPFDLTQGTYRTSLFKLAPNHWVWIFVQHHIACDAKSGAIMAELVSQQYAALLEDLAAPVAEQPSYFDSITPITRPIKRTDATGSFPYGVTQVGDPVSVRVPVPFSTDQLNALATSSDFRLFTPDLSRYALYLTLYMAFLARVTGDEKITIGTPSHNRMNNQTRATLGLFVEVLPIGAPVTADDSLRDLHARVKTALGRFLRTAKPGAVETAETTGFAYILNYIQANFDGFAGSPMDVAWMHPGAHDAQHALRLHVMDFVGSGAPDLALDVNCAVSVEVEPEQIALQFAVFAKEALNKPDAKLAEIPLAADATGVVRGPAQADKPSVLAQFLRHAETTPEKIALQHVDDTHSYASVAQKAERLATRLTTIGVQPGNAVVLHMARSVDYVVGVLGTMMAGAHFVPIASSNPATRARDIASRANASAIITDLPRAEIFDGMCIPVLGGQNDGAIVKPILPKGDDLAYLIFTSGSTGTPKGVAVDHAGLSSYIDWAVSEFGGPDYPLFTSISFDLTITSLFVPLTTGGRLVVYPEPLTGPDLSVLDVFADDAVDTVKLTPAHLSLACQADKQVARIKTLVLGGENLSVGLCRRAQDVLGSIQILNEYGPTEAVVGSMIYQFDAEHDTGASVPIGRPAAGVTISLRDAGLNPVPTGVIGEICIGGRLAKGYTDSDLTAAKFIVRPDRMYRSGDLGRIGRDGTIAYLGRADMQVKQGSVRIEPAEIESALLNIENVAAAFVGTPADRKVDQTCVRCGLAADYPGAQFDEAGLCHICTQFDGYKDRAEAYFGPSTELSAKIDAAKANRTGKHDAIMLLSGGKDSTYAAYRLAELTTNVLALTLDNGFLSDEAMTNIKKVTEHLGWDHQFMTTPAMNDIFVDSLKRHSNVCQGCFKTVYTLALREARDQGIPAIVTGLSRGQFFETRLTPELFQNAAPSQQQLEAMVLEARKQYHAEDDSIAKHLDTRDIRDGEILTQVEIIDLYRYIDVSVSEIYRYLSEHATWTRPSDTGRSTNCLINDLGIYFHRKREGFHNYELPYSWDVRMGHKTRDEALDELDDEIDVPRMEDMLRQIGFDEPIERPGLIAYVVTTASESEIWDELRRALSAEMLPAGLILMDEMPITPNGKVDCAMLPRSRPNYRPTKADYKPPQTPTQLRLAEIFREILALGQIGMDDDFFDLGGDSLSAVKIAISANEAGILLPATALFEHRTLAALATYADKLKVATPDGDGNDLVGLDDLDLDAISEALR